MIINYLARARQTVCPGYFDFKDFSIVAKRILKFALFDYSIRIMISIEFAFIGIMVIIEDICDYH